MISLVFGDAVARNHVPWLHLDSFRPWAPRPFGEPPLAAYSVPYQCDSLVMFDSTMVPIISPAEFLPCDLLGEADQACASTAAQSSPLRHDCMLLQAPVRLRRGPGKKLPVRPLPPPEMDPPRVCGSLLEVMEFYTRVVSVLHDFKAERLI